MKKYVIIGGVNGAGKSTLYQSIPNMHNMLRVNTDEILREFGDWRNMADILKAGKIAVGLINEYFSDGVSFNQETTLCGKTIEKNIQKAKKLGYIVELHYVGVDSVDIAKSRVLDRVSKGGHGIPEKDIEKRYYESLRKLPCILKDCDLAVFYDNTEEFRRFAIYKNGILVRSSHMIPRWFINSGCNLKLLMLVIKYGDLCSVSEAEFVQNRTEIISYRSFT